MLDRALERDHPRFLALIGGWGAKNRFASPRNIPEQIHFENVTPNSTVIKNIAMGKFLEPNLQRNHLDARALLRDADAPHTIIPAMASLVRVATGYRLQPSRRMASGVAPRRRTEMDFGHQQRFGTTLGLSEVQRPTRTLVVHPLSKFALGFLDPQTRFKNYFACWKFLDPRRALCASNKVIHERRQCEEAEGSGTG